jgi:hypothetical protein
MKPKIRVFKDNIAVLGNDYKVIIEPSLLNKQSDENPELGVNR